MNTADRSQKTNAGEPGAFRGAAAVSRLFTDGAPRRTLTLTNAAPGFATLWWTPPSSTNWVLQERLSLSTGSWTNSPSGWTNPVVVPATLPMKFYRLFKP